MYNQEPKRLKTWDYTKSGYYFITICTRAHENCFGLIENHKVILNEVGEIAQKFWKEISTHFANTRLDEFIVMPNHLHGIIIIENFQEEEYTNCNSVETCHGMSLQRKFALPQSGSISMIINQYKGAVKRYCNKNNIQFIWQRRFFDRIIRTEKELNNIRNYIINNPLGAE